MGGANDRDQSDDKTVISETLCENATKNDISLLSGMKTVIKRGENKSFDVLICEVIVCAFWISSDLNYISVPNNYQHLLLNFF